MRLVLDAGALIAIDRADRETARLMTLARRNGADVITVAPVVGQVWRDGQRQARLARALRLVDVLDVDLATAQAAGETLRLAGASDVVDALVSLATRSGDSVLTSDPDDINTLLEARGVAATLVRV